MRKAGLLFVLLVLVSVGARANDVQGVFDACEVTGSTTLYDLKTDRWFKTDVEDAEQRTLPASTFKIFHSLVALDVGVTKPDEVFEWDGVERGFPIWNQDTVFADAFKNSTVWVYEELARRIDKGTYKRYLDWARYGNDDISNGKDGNFWVYGSFGVSPIEQIEMLVKFYRHELPFSSRSVAFVQEFMHLEDGVYGKTGWTIKGGQHIGWWIGYRETKGAPLFFATRIIKNEDKALNDFTACRKTITDEVIKKWEAHE